MCCAPMRCIRTRREQLTGNLGCSFQRITNRLGLSGQVPTLILQQATVTRLKDGGFVLVVLADLSIP